MAEETLYLIDAFAQIFRAYYAIRGGMRSPATSEPTHAVFGITGMLLKLFNEFHPTYVVVAVDAPGKTFRDELYSEYKGTRSSTPDDLTSQIPRIFELIELFGIPMISQSGLEADDVIACVTHRVLEDPKFDGVKIRLVSKDKDLEQLLGDRVSMFDIHTDTMTDAAALLLNKGVRPDQVIDLLTLTGDTVDNVRGVEGIGPKTAAQLLQQYDSIEGIYAHIDEIKGKRRESLEKALGHIALSRELVTLKCDVPLPFSMEAARVQPMKLPGLLSLFQQLGFNRYQDEVKRLAASGHGLQTESTVDGEQTVPDPSPAVTEAAAPSEVGSAQTSGAVYRAITSVNELSELAAELRGQPMLSVDTETTGLERDAKLCGISLAWRPGEAVYIPVRSPSPAGHLTEEAVVAVLRPLLEDPGIPKCGHNLKFDAHVLLRSGIHLRGAQFDSMLAASLIDPGHGTAKLDNLALATLDYHMIPITALIGEGSAQLSMDEVELDVITPYAAEDADIALQLYHALAPRLDEMELRALMREVEAPLTLVLAEMESNGILCNPDELIRQGEQLGERVEEIKRSIYEAAGFTFDLNSTKQLGDTLFDRLGFKEGKKTKTGRSTDVEVLEKLAADEDRTVPHTSVPRLVLEYRQLQKLISTYLGNLRTSIRPETGRIHTTFHQLVTATGRIASNGPNLQNIPIRTDVGRQIRKAFFAAPDCCLICADYSQIELRLLAHLSGDPVLIDAFERDLDIHVAVAAEVFGVDLESVTREQRNQAKTINFGIIYGVTPYGLSRRVEGLDVPAATQLIADYRKRYAGIDSFLQQCIGKALADGYVSTILGRRRSIPEVHSSSVNTRNLGERLAINSVVQGSAADLIKTAMVNVQRRIDRDGMPVRMLLQIHDELVFETPAEGAQDRADELCREMEQAMKLRVPLKADVGIGQDWMSAK